MKTEKEEVWKVLEDAFAAISAKDSKKVISHYASDAIIYDCKPPFQTKGAIAWKHTWEACFPYFPDKFRFETRDVHIHVGEDLAFAHFMMRIITDDTSHDAAQTWMRCTSCLKRQQSKWKIVHEHGSLPYNPHTMQAVSTLEI